MQSQSEFIVTTREQALDKAVVFAVGAPAVKLLDGDREDADAASDRDTDFDELGDNGGMFASEGADDHGVCDAVADGPQADHSTQDERNDAESSLHGEANPKNPGRA